MPRDGTRSWWEGSVRPTGPTRCCCSLRGTTFARAPRSTRCRSPNGCPRRRGRGRRRRRRARWGRLLLLVGLAGLLLLRVAQVLARAAVGLILDPTAADQRVVALPAAEQVHGAGTTDEAVVARIPSQRVGVPATD